jgi:hypothetical protein
MGYRSALYDSVRPRPPWEHAPAPVRSGRLPPPRDEPPPGQPTRSTAASAPWRKHEVSVAADAPPVHVCHRQQLCARRLAA